MVEGKEECSCKRPTEVDNYLREYEKRIAIDKLTMCVIWRKIYATKNVPTLNGLVFYLILNEITQTKM